MNLYTLQDGDDISGLAEGENSIVLPSAEILDILGQTSGEYSTLWYPLCKCFSF